MPLTAMAALEAQVRDKAYKLNDTHGLYLLVTPQGCRYLAVERLVGDQPVKGDVFDDGFPIHSE